jgi:hypothetical protein
LALRHETTEFILQIQDMPPGLISTANSNLGQEFFPHLSSWLRVFSAPSLQIFEQKAARAGEQGIPFDALGYGIEMSKSTPEEEWKDLVGSTEAAKAIAEQFGKLLILAPGFQLMTQNWDDYPRMAALADGWILQTQRLQIKAPGDEYRNAVHEVLDQIRAGNPEIRIWAQITFLPDRPPDADEWLSYHHSIIDLVEGTYIGIYIWEDFDKDVILDVVEEIYARACGG